MPQAAPVISPLARVVRPSWAVPPVVRTVLLDLCVAAIGAAIIALPMLLLGFPG